MKSVISESFIVIRAVRFIGFRITDKSQWGYFREMIVKYCLTTVGLVLIYHPLSETMAV